MKTIDEAMEIAKGIKASGEVLAKATVMATNNLAIAGLVLRSALAEVEYNIRVQGMDQEAYETIKAALETTLAASAEKALLPGTTNSSGGVA